ncbi:uncharacterized protein LOC124371712 [Homalodisca vitripennis]|uniref:uncharacterized protein LOC124371712 n=1 Tax=Homalodisca vitripennis TaxID=197043 RepID=UPI001EE9D76B|nr:uncharacterized protein LOC124371712 [Homalodisca vitripennis]
MMQRGKLMVELAEKRLSVINVTLPAANEVSVAENLEEDVPLTASISVPTVATVNLPTMKETRHRFGLADNIEHGEPDVAAAKEGIPVPVEVGSSPLIDLEEVDEQAVEIPLSYKKEKLRGTNQESARPSRNKKSIGREKVQKILQQTDDSINDPLFSSDSDVL